MRLFLSIAVIACGCGAVRAAPGKIIVDDTNKVDDKRWKPYDVRLHREERVHGEVIVLSPPLFVRGPPKGFPFKVRTKRSKLHGRRSNDGQTLKQHSEVSPVTSIGTYRARRAGTLHDEPRNFKITREKRATSHGRLSGRQNRLPDHYDPELPRNPSYYQPGRVQGEVVVHSSNLSIKGPPKGLPLRRKTRQAPEIPEDIKNSTKTQNKLPISQKAVKHASEESTALQASSVTSDSTTEQRRGQGTKLKPAKGRQSMMKRLKAMWPYMLIPTMMTLGYAPFLLANLKMFVMNALMLNMMAFNAAIMLTLRNMVFGPRVGGHTKYVNYGYSRPHHRGHHDKR